MQLGGEFGKIRLLCRYRCHLNSNGVLYREPHGGRPFCDRPHIRPASTGTSRDFHRARGHDRTDV